MGWASVGLSLVLASTPATSSSARRFNLEPLVLGAVGLLGAGAGAWRLAEADSRYQALTKIPPTASSPQEASAVLAQARELVFRGKSETVAGAVMLAAGGAVLLGALVWWLVEGLETTDWLIGVGNAGLTAIGRF